MSSSRSLGEMTSTLIGFRLVSASARGGSSASVALIRCSRSTSTASASRKMFESAWPAICARFGYSLLGDALARRLVHAAGADDEDALGAEVDGRRDRRRLAHRAVAAVLGVAGDVEGDRRKDERDRRRRQQVRDRDRGAHRDPLRARPRHDVVERVVEGDVQARAVARRGDRERMQMAFGHHAVQPARCRRARSSSFSSGELSSSERGRARRQRAITQPIDIIVSQRAPVRITPNESER